MCQENEKKENCDEILRRWVKAEKITADEKDELLAAVKRSLNECITLTSRLNSVE